MVEPTGAETMVVLRVGEKELIARFEPDDAPAVGDRVTLAIDMSKACMFDRDRTLHLTRPARCHRSPIEPTESQSSMTIAELTPRPGSFATYPSLRDRVV